MNKGLLLFVPYAVLRRFWKWPMRRTPIKHVSAFLLLKSGITLSSIVFRSDYCGVQSHFHLSSFFITLESPSCWFGFFPLNSCYQTACLFGEGNRRQEGSETVLVNTNNIDEEDIWYRHQKVGEISLEPSQGSMPEWDWLLSPSKVLNTENNQVT